uniref:Uncharacterized protein n=1 Tax=Panagrolaimus davidi TaxID=227884 RepID=A0A914PRY8_9BILA
MNPLYDNFCKHRTILSIQQPDYRKEIKILFGTPSSNGKNLCGIKGFTNLIEVGSEQKSNVVKKDLSRQEELLNHWEEMDDIVGIVNHPHEFNKNGKQQIKINESTDLSSSSDEEEETEPIWNDGKRFHKIHLSPINSHVWAVLVLEDENDEIKLQSSYSVNHKILIPANEL